MANTNTLRENCRNLFDSEIKQLINSDSKKDEERGKRLEKAGKEIKCFYCLNYEIVYKDREGMFANMDGRGNYDLINCICCKGNTNWVGCSSSPTTSYPGISKRGDRERTWIEGKARKNIDSLSDQLEKKIGAL